MEALGGRKNQVTTISKPPKTLPKRKPAIIVRRGNETFPELLRAIKSNARTEVTGKNISKIRETKNGSLLIEVSGNEEDADRVTGEITRALGPEGSIRSSKQRNLVELRDLDVLSDGEQITSSITQAYDLKTDEIRAISIRKTFDGNQAATLLLPLEIANKLIGVGWLKIGLVYCRVKAGTRRVRCYRCLAFRHEARICTSPDRGKNCRKCGEVGHYALNCKADKELIYQFRDNLHGKNDVIESKPRQGEPTGETLTIYD